MSFSEIMQEVLGEMDGKPVSARISADVTELGPSHLMIRSGSLLKEIFVTSTEEITDGNMLGAIECKILTERERIFTKYFSSNKVNGASTKKGVILKAPMPGMVKAISVTVGDKVQKNTQVLVLEAMKMENSILAGFAGTITKVNIQTGASVEKGMPLIEFE